MTRKFLIPFLVVFLIACEKSSDTKDVLKFYGDAYEDIGYSVSKTDNGYLIAGQFTHITRRLNPKYITGSIKKMVVIRTDNDGNEIRKELLGVNTCGSRLITLEDGNIAITGYTIDSVTLQKDIYVVKLEANGEGYTEKIFKSNGNQYGTDIVKTQEGFLIMGTTDVRREPSTEATGNAEGKNDILLLRLNNNLDLISSLTTGFIGNDDAKTLKEDINGGYIIAGTTDRSDKLKAEQDGKNIFLLRINNEVSTTQFRILGGVKDEFAADIEVLNDGYLVAGTVGTEGTMQSGYIWKMSEDIFDVPVLEHPIILETQQKSFTLNAICRYKTNTFLMAGQYGSGSSDMLIFATDRDGNFIEGKMKVARGTGTQVAYDVIADGESVIAVGKNSYENNSMITLLKFSF